MKMFIFGSYWLNLLQKQYGNVLLPSKNCGAGELTIEELFLIAHIVKKYQPKRIFEIGTYRGTSTVTMALNSPDDCKIYTLDVVEQPPQEDEDIEWIADYKHPDDVGIQFRNPEAEFTKKAYSKIVQLWGNSTTFDYSPYMDMDLVFVDGSHDFNTAYSDLYNALSMTSGIVLAHDYAIWEPGVMGAVQKILKNFEIHFYVWKGASMIGFGDELEDLLDD